jgi:SAM-dependent methyltransferase
VFSFIAGGGQLTSDVDMFQALDLSQARENDFDTFDHFDASYKATVQKSPSFIYEYGSDWKPNLIEKSRALNFYKNLIVHDNNQALPFDDNRFDYVYSNSSYWVKNFREHINDLVRITKPGGHIVLEIKTKEIEQFSSFNYAKSLMGNTFCKIIDAGRLQSWHGLQTLAEFDKLVGDIKVVDIVSREPLYGDIMAYIWDIGLRPIFNPIMKLVGNVDPKIRQEVKVEWCETIYNLMSDFVENYEPTEESAIEWIYVLQKKALPST